MYQDFYLRFSDELAAEQALVALYAAVTFPNVDRVGVIFGLNGAPVPGWHVNVRLQATDVFPAALEPFLIDPPLHPKRVWASNDESVT